MRIPFSRKSGIAQGMSLEEAMERWKSAEDISADE